MRKLHRTDQRAKELEATIFALPQNQSRPKLRAENVLRAVAALTMGGLHG
jgi:hypothetical protein